MVLETTLTHKSFGCDFSVIFIQKYIVLMKNLTVVPLGAVVLFWTPRFFSRFEDESASQSVCPYLPTGRVGGLPLENTRTFGEYFRGN